MSVTTKALTTRDGALWIQPGGPNTKPEYLGCHDLGDISEPAGSIELLRCMDKKKGGWKTVGATQAPPDPITTSIEDMTFLERDWLEKLMCDFNLYATQRSGGEPDSFDNYDRALILSNARVTNSTYSQIVHHEEENASMQSRDIEAWPPLIKMGKMTCRRQDTSQTLALNDVYSYSPLDCEERILPGDRVAASGDASLYSGDVLQTLNAGQLWAALATDPFATGKNGMSITAFMISRTITRILVAQEATGGAQGLVAYTDDNGATWTTVNIGGASAGHGAVDSGALFALDQGHVWLVSALGYIYFSSDGGASWAAQTSGSLTVENGHAISFMDVNTGMAVFESDVILITTDGGVTWEASTAVTGSGDDLNTVTHNFGDFWWVGTAGGEFYYSRDMGVTWTIRAFPGSGAGQVTDMAFANELVGYALHNSAAPVGRILVTINGGWTWLPITTSTNAGLNALSIADDSTVYAVGEVEDGTAVIVKATWD